MGVFEELMQALQQNPENCGADRSDEYAWCDRPLVALDLTNCYQFWVCENLGGEAERVQSWPIEAVLSQTLHR